jgi:LPS-assembly lipoprotein
MRTLTLRHLILAGLGMVAMLILSSCGFALKGATKPLPVTELGVQASTASTVLPELATALAARGVRLLAASEPAAAHLPRLVLSEDQRSKVVLSTSTAGRVREYQLSHQVTVQLFDDQGRPWLEAITVSKQRNFSYNDSQVLAKEIEERAVSKALQHDIVLAIMARLESLVAAPAALKP